MTYEPVRRGNPLQLTVNQHVHSRYAIEKFYDDDNTVEMYLVKTAKRFRTSSKNGLFCALRSWDERSEKGYMAAIETEFNDQIDLLSSHPTRKHHAISKYFLLWQIRHEYHCERLSDGLLKGIEGEFLTKTEQEILEKKGIGYVNENAEIPSRQITGTQIQIRLDHQMHDLWNVQWGLVEAKEGEFICADAYQKLLFLPIRPNLAFVGNHSDQCISREQVVNINRQSVSSATRFYFARDFEKCPLA